MNTTATDAAIEELEQLVEIEEAGYRLVMTRHRQEYIGAEPGPWDSRGQSRAAAASFRPETNDPLLWWCPELKSFAHIRISALLLLVFVILLGAPEESLGAQVEIEAHWGVITTVENVYIANLHVDNHAAFGAHNIAPARYLLSIREVRDTGRLKRYADRRRVGREFREWMSGSLDITSVSIGNSHDVGRKIKALGHRRADILCCNIPINKNRIARPRNSFKGAIALNGGNSDDELGRLGRFKGQHLLKSCAGIDISSIGTLPSSDQRSVEVKQARNANQCSYGRNPVEPFPYGELRTSIFLLLGVPLLIFGICLNSYGIDRGAFYVLMTGWFFMVGGGLLIVLVLVPLLAHFRELL